MTTRISSVSFGGNAFDLGQFCSADLPGPSTQRPQSLALTIGPRSNGSADESTEMSLPADACLTGHDSEYHASPHDRDDKAEENRERTSRIPSAQHQESEIPEDHSTRSDMH